MRSLLLSLLLSVVTAAIALAQTSIPEHSISPKDGGNAEFRGTWSPYELEDPFIRRVTPVEIEHEKDSLVEAIKRPKTLKKLENLRETDVYEPKASSVGKDFEANNFDGCTPPDNGLAVSNGGFIVSVVNCNVELLDTAGTSFSVTGLGPFFGNSSGFFYDPRVIYDNQFDRFVMVCLEDFTPSTSTLHIAFSATNDPRGSWNFYTIRGNVANANTWFDFPALGLKNGEVIVTGNLFDASDNFSESIILQIDKDNGYIGGSVGFSFYSNILTSTGLFLPFSMHPVTHALGKPIGDTTYLVSTNAGGSFRFRVYEITGKRGNPSTALNLYTATLPFGQSYTIGGDALQPSTTNTLDVGDCRVQDVLLQNNNIYFTFNKETSGNYNGVGIGKISLNNLTVSSMATISTGASTDFVYGAIAGVGATEADERFYLSGQYSTNTTFNSMYGVELNGSTMTTVGTFDTLKTGTSYIPGIGSSTTARWGDYTDAQRLYNSNPIKAYVVGHVGSNNFFSRFHTSFIVEIEDDAPVGIDNYFSPITSINTFPNPTNEWMHVVFEQPKTQHLQAVIYDQMGRKVEVIQDSDIREGKQKLTFYTGTMQEGNYVLIVNTQDEELAKVPFVVAH